MSYVKPTATTLTGIRFVGWLIPIRLTAIGLISTLALGLLAWPLPTEAQEPGKVYRIGYLFPPAGHDESLLVAFKQGLQQLGYVEGKNIVIEQRYGKRHQLAALAFGLQNDTVASCNAKDGAGDAGPGLPGVGGIRAVPSRHA